MDGANQASYSSSGSYSSYSGSYSSDGSDSSYSHSSLDEEQEIDDDKKKEKINNDALTSEGKDEHLVLLSKVEHEEERNELDVEKEVNIYVERETPLDYSIDREEDLGSAERIESRIQTMNSNSGEKSVLMKISDEESVLIQLSHADTQSNDEDEGVELEVVSSVQNAEDVNEDTKVTAQYNEDENEVMSSSDSGVLDAVSSSDVDVDVDDDDDDDDDEFDVDVDASELDLASKSMPSSEHVHHGYNLEALSDDNHLPNVISSPDTKDVNQGAEVAAQSTENEKEDIKVVENEEVEDDGVFDVVLSSDSDVDSDSDSDVDSDSDSDVNSDVDASELDIASKSMASLEHVHHGYDREALSDDNHLPNLSHSPDMDEDNQERNVSESCPPLGKKEYTEENSGYSDIEKEDCIPEDNKNSPSEGIKIGQKALDDIENVVDASSQINASNNDAIEQNIISDENRATKEIEDVAKEKEDVHINNNSAEQDSLNLCVDDVVYIAKYETNPFQISSNIILDTGVSIIAEKQVQRDDNVFEKFHKLKKRKVKTNSVWWIEDNGSSEGKEHKTDEKLDKFMDKTDDWFAKQLHEAERSASELDVGALNARLQYERSMVKSVKETNIWWEVGKGMKKKSTSSSIGSRQWFFDSMIEKENLYCIANNEENSKVESKVVIQKSKCSWLTEADANDNNKLKEYMKKDEKKQENNIAHAAATEISQVVKGESKNDSDDHSVEESEKLDSRPKSMVDVIEKLQTEVIEKIVNTNNANEDAEGGSIPMKDILSFQKDAKEVRTSKEILKRNSKKSKKFVVTLDTPTSQIKDLIDGAMGESISRRTNAVGTIKLLASKKQNVSMLIKSDGLVKALVFVAVEKIVEETIEASQNARLRALAALSMLSQPKDGRRIICAQDGVLQCLVDMIGEGTGEVCIHACSTIAALSKTEENREKIMAKTGLLRKLSLLVRNTEVTMENDQDDASVDDTDEQSTSSESNQVSISTTDKQINAIRLNACAALLHLSKSCAVAVS
jgi:hypothetical protein